LNVSSTPLAPAAELWDLTRQCLSQSQTHATTRSAGAVCRCLVPTRRHLAEKRLTHKVTALGRGYFTCDFEMHLVIRFIVEEIDEIGAYVTETTHLYLTTFIYLFSASR